ncbi:MAG TPA: uroporphyrinogen decarboxylase family protein [Chloroflexota bacterium]
MNKRERVDAAVRGQPLDRPPVSAWRHFVDRESNAADLAGAMLAWYREYDWDFLKVNPRATYAVEGWGNQYDFSRYQGVAPTPVENAIERPADLARIRPLDPGSGPFGEQLEAVRRIAREVGGDGYVIQTIFSPLSYLVTLAGGAGAVTGPGSAASRVRELESAEPEAFRAALRAIATTLAAYAGELLRAGADGIFFAVVRIARDAQLTREEYGRLGRPGDFAVLDAVRAARFNVLHVCGDGIHLDAFADYPVQAWNWDVLGRGNPELAEGQRLLPGAVAGGTAEAGALQSGTPEQVAALVRDAIASTGGQRLIVAPGCSVKPPQSEANLRALRRAVEAG